MKKYSNLQIVFGVLLILFLCNSILFCQKDTVNNSSFKLWYNHPATVWTEALPIGNGSFGGMVFGGVETERVQLNDDTFWSGKSYDPNNPEALKNLPIVRELIKTGKYEEAMDLANEKLMGNPIDLMKYQPLGDLRLFFNNHSDFTNYRRELDLERAVIKISYEVNDIKYTREIFSSFPDQVLVYHFKSSKTGAISFKATLNSKQTFITKYSDDKLIMNGRWGVDINELKVGLINSNETNKNWDKGGISFEANLKAFSKNGKIFYKDDSLYVESADEVTLILATSTNYLGKNPSEICSQRIVKAEQPYKQLLSNHVKDYQSLFKRVDISLGKNENENLPTDERLNRIKLGELDPSLVSLYYQFGRYLMISGSRPGTQPLNLQGIWNDDLQPAWGSKYTININTEMNYWPAEITNLSECHEPLFDLIESLVEPGKKTARIHYNCKGFVAHHNTDLWRATTPVDGARWGLWPMGGAWLSTHLFMHYDYTRNKDFLKRAYPIMKEAAKFIIDFLIEDEQGRLVTNPSHSPENSFIDANGNVGVLCVGATMDFQIINLLFTNLIKSSEVLGFDEKFRDTLKNTLSKIPPLQIGKYGQLQEWLEDYEENEPGHRHVSHLFGLFPGNQIGVHTTPELAKAARTTLERRLQFGGGHTGWSRAWIINLWARLKDAQKAYENVQQLLAKSTLPNLFDDHPPFQIDGNFGGTTGINEMLMQSYNDEINILPALPNQWETGFIKGIKARGNFEVNINWKNGELDFAEIKSFSGEKCNLRYRDKTFSFDTKIGNSYKLNSDLTFVK